ncbi:MAG: hypothetical protein ACREGF_05320 [Candidatus Saccharimonadales bacterium]
MAKIVFLALFVLAISGLGVFVPAGGELSFLLPRFYVSVGGLILGSLLLICQLVDSYLAQGFGGFYRRTGWVLLALLPVRLIWPNGWLAQLSNVDFFVILPLGFSFLMLWLEDETTPIKSLAWLKIIARKIYLAAWPKLVINKFNPRALLKVLANKFYKFRQPRTTTKVKIHSQLSIFKARRLRQFSLAQFKHPEPPPDQTL